MKKGIVSIIIGVLIFVVGILFTIVNGYEWYGYASGSTVFTDANGVVQGYGLTIAFTCIAAVIAVAGIILLVCGIKQLKKNKK